MCDLFNLVRFEGYIPGAEAVASVTSIAQKLRQKNPELIYLLDRKPNLPSMSSQWTQTSFS